jgi:catechol 2,3-dioxygenase-like lactoylglutathione lyase family enzyme
MSPSPTVQSIGQIHVSVSNVERSLAFYRDQVGLTFLFQFPGMAFFDCGGVRLYLATPEKPEFGGTSILYFRVASIETAHAELSGRGVPFVGPPHRVHADARHELWMAFFTDPDGHTMALMSEVATTPPPQ